MTTRRPGSEKPYKLLVPPKIVKVLDLIPDEDYRRIRTAILGLASTPRPHGAKKLEGAIYRIRVGRYRVIYSVDDKATDVILLKVATEFL